MSSSLLYQGVPNIPDRSEHLKARSLTPDPCSLQRVAEGDTLHEECGVTAIHGHPDAARQAYLALYALQHRGQESAGIASADGHHLANIKGMGLVSEIFTDDVLQKLPGSLLEASADLGAPALTTFRRVVLPSVFPALVAGSIFTFSLTMGDYIAVTIVGGKTQMLGNVIYGQLVTANNQPLAAALTVIPIVAVLLYLLALRGTGALEEAS